MIVGISPQDSLTYWTQLGIKRFNIDEPWHNNFGYEFVEQLDAQLPADGKLYVSEYHHEACAWGHDGLGSHNAINRLINDYAPLVSSKTKFGTHSKWEYFDGIGRITDPRYQWTQLRDALAGQGKFEHGWVATVKNVGYLVGWARQRASIEDMQLIWGHANNIAANTVLIYVEGPDYQYYPDVLEDALRAAFQAGGWVEREEEKVQAVFCCTTQTYDPESCELLEIRRLGEFRWV